MRVVCLSRNTMMSAWKPGAYGDVLEESKHFYVVKSEYPSVTKIYPKKAKFYKCEVLKSAK